MARNGFWGKFDELMNSIPEYIDHEINTVGNNNVVISNGSIVRQKSSFGSSTSIISQGGNKIEVTTKN